MDIKKIKEIINVFEESDIDKIKVKENDFEIELEKNANQNIVIPNNMPNITQQSNVSNISESKEESISTINAPLVGTFYEKPSPDAKAFVSVGQSVKVGDTLCIIEAMKVMNEIKSDQAGVIKDILVKDGSLVEYDEALFIIE